MVSEWVRLLHEAFNFESPWQFALFVAALFGLTVGVGAGAFGFFVDKGFRRAEEKRLLELRPHDDPYDVSKGPSFRIDTLDQDLRKVGLWFTSLSSPQLKPTPETDGGPMEYFELGNGLYLRAQWRPGRKMSPKDRALAERIILAHEARLKS
jgi:hypothetical protein